MEPCAPYSTPAEEAARTVQQVHRPTAVLLAPSKRRDWESFLRRCWIVAASAVAASWKEVRVSHDLAAALAPAHGAVSDCAADGAALFQTAVTLTEGWTVRWPGAVLLPRTHRKHLVPANKHSCQHFLQLWLLQERRAPLQMSAVLSRGVQPGQYMCQHGMPHLLELIFEGLIVDVVLPPLGHESLSQVVAEMHLCYCLGCCVAVTMVIVRLFQSSSHETVLYDSRAGCPCRPSAAERGRDIRYSVFDRSAFKCGPPNRYNARINVKNFIM